MRRLNQRGSVLAVVSIVAVIVVVVTIIVAAITIGVYKSTHHTQRTFTLNDKAIITTNSNGNGHQYMFFTDQGTFKDTDSVLNRKYNSSDLYGQLKVGHKYTCDTTGFRWDVGSEYPNLISCTEVKS